MNIVFTTLFEHAVPGLAEHAVPVTDAWTRRGHRALVMAPPAAMAAVRAAHAGLACPDRLEFRAFDGTPPDWRRIHAMFNIIPAGAGPAFRDLHAPCHIPRVTINHGLTDKATTFPAAYPGHPIGYNNVLLACGPAMFKGSWESYTQKWPETRAALKIIPVGAPKTDVLFSGVYRRDDVLRGLQLDPARPTALYAPTYQKEASLEQAGPAIMETLAALDINLIVRLHHLSLDSSIPSAVRAGHGGRDWRAILRTLASRHPNLRMVEGDSNPYFVAADLLVGDVSGACFEFILQDKPVIFFDVPDFFTAHGTAGVGYWGRSAGRIVHSTAELAAATRAELADPERHAAARHELITQLVHQRGGAADRAVDALLDLIEGRIEYPTWGPRINLRMDAMLRAYLLERLERCALETQAVALFGAGAHAVYLLDLMAAARAAGRRMPRPALILDDQPPAATMHGFPVAKPCPAQRGQFDAILLASDWHQPRMRQRCVEVFGAALPVVDLYAAFPWQRPGPG